MLMLLLLLLRGRHLTHGPVKSSWRLPVRVDRHWLVRRLLLMRLLLLLLLLGMLLPLLRLLLLLLLREAMHGALLLLLRVHGKARKWNALLVLHGGVAGHHGLGRGPSTAPGHKLLRLEVVPMLQVLLLSTCQAHLSSHVGRGRGRGRGRCCRSRLLLC